MIRVLFGEFYTSAGSILKILSIGMIFATLSGISANFFSGIGKPKINSKIIYSAAIFNLIGNLILIPMIGIVGAAITTTTSYFMMMVLGLKNTKKFISVKFPVLMWIKTLIAGILLILAIGLLKRLITLNVLLETAIILIIAGIIYSILLFSFRIINIEEVKNLYRRIMT